MKLTKDLGEVSTEAYMVKFNLKILVKFPLRILPGEVQPEDLGEVPTEYLACMVKFNLKILVKFPLRILHAW